MSLKIVFPKDFDERAEFEAEQRGVLANLTVQENAATSWRVSFYTPERLALELGLAAKSGEPYLGEPGMIIVPNIQCETLLEIVTALFCKG